jgi:RNA polymerase sigma-70 factor, ECF subfamily
MQSDISFQFDRLYPAVFRYYRLRGADPDTANDLASATFERALRNLSSYDEKKGSFPSWIFTIAHNLAINHWKSPANRATSLDFDLPASEPPLEMRLIEHEDQQNLFAALSKLDERERDLLALKFASRFTNRKIAEMTGLSESNVGVILYRALRRLRLSLTRTMEVSHE